MTPEQAIALLNAVSAEAPLTRRVHNDVIKALEVLQKIVKELKEKE